MFLLLLRYKNVCHAWFRLVKVTIQVTFEVRKTLINTSKHVMLNLIVSSVIITRSGYLKVFMSIKLSIFRLA